MAIETVEIITRDGMSIGLSKSLVDLYNDGDLTPQELAKFSYAAWEAPECNAYATTEIDISSQQGAAVTSQLSYFQSPMGGSNIVSAYVNDLLPTNRLYCFNILLYTDRYYENLTIDNTSDCDVVTDIDLTACAMTLYSAPDENGNVSIDYPDAQTIKKFTSGASSYFHDDDLVKHWNGSSWVRMNNIRPYCVIANDSGILFITQGSYFGDREIGGFGSAGYNFCPMNSLKLPEGDHIIDQKWNYSQGDIVDYTKTKHLLRWIGNDQEYESQTWGSGSKKGAWSYDDNFFVIMSQTNQVYGIANDEYHIYPKSLNVVKRLIACVGLNVYIGNDKTSVIKPIIEGGLVVGYSEDASTPSEIDTITNVTGNNISPFPPSPGPTPSSGDDMEAMATGASGSSGGFTHFYVMSPQDLIDLLADFYDHASSGETISNNLVCSYILGIPSSEFCATESVPVAIHNSAQGTPFVSQANYSHITATNNLLVIGSFNVPRITNTFYDFAPYSTYEVFIPCCGWVSLPDTVAGRSINVEMYIDIASCCLKAAVKTNDLGVCAVTNGVLGAAIPMAVIESGILRGNNIQAGLGIIGGGINTGVGAGSGNAMGIGFGVQQILNGLVECTIAGNTNYTQQKGGTGDITQFAMGHKCYMKVTHPDIDEVVNNSIFGHSVGYLCNSIDTLSNFSGFTVCGNPHVTFSASAEEREEIERLLSMGVIL